jgi:hypothetical protein
MREAQEASGIGRISFGYFSLAEKCSCIFSIRHIHVAFRTKKSISSVGTRTHIKISVAVATHLTKPLNSVRGELVEP